MLTPFDADGAPNLDDFSADPADFAAMREVFLFYAAYCDLKEKSTQFRLKGSVGLAATIDDEARKLYRQLPERARW